MKTQALVMLSALAFAPALSRAQEQATATAVPAATESPAEAPAGPAASAVVAIVRGLYVEGKVGGGYMLQNATFEVDRSRYPDAPANEPLGPGSTVQMAIGYDLADFLALQVVGGAYLVSATSGQEPVRDLGIVFGGLGVRGGFGLSDRLRIAGSAGVAYASADNQVEKSKAGVAILAGLGLEYYVHVRHFSVGVELLAFVPVSPMRVFVGVAPQVKYTF